MVPVVQGSHVETPELDSTAARYVDEQTQFYFTDYQIISLLIILV